uniref:PAS domain-containing protein n=1 Tax=Streptomyces xiaopingdaonensis TaxID=1565415 RepID=UPI0003775620
MSSRPSRGAARLAAILDALPDALILVNCNGTVVNANSIALEVFESPGTALVGRGLLDLLPEFDSKRIPGSMRRPEEIDEAAGRTKPQRMTARRTDGSTFAVEVTSANLEDPHTPYASAVEAAFADYGTSGSGGYTGDELLMLVVRDLTGTLDTEAELSRQQRQTEMILRAASEGVMGVDAQGRIVLVNPAAAQILGHRAGDLGGQELHPLVHHSRADGTPLPFEETPLADTLRSGRKHRVRVGQVLWAKDGRPVPVDMTSAPVRDGEQLVGAVLTFTDRRPYDELAARHQQLEAVVGEGLRGPLERMRTELSGLADDPAGQLWPEANQILRHLAAGYGRMTTLVDNVLRYQRLDSGAERLKVRTVRLDEVVQSAIEGADELIGPGRAQFAVHTPPIDAELDAEQLATALAHLVADVAGVDSTGNAAPLPPGVDPTIVVAVAQRGEAVRIEVRGPYSGGDRVHQPLVRGIVGKHGGVLQTHEVPGAGGSAFVVELPTVGAAEASRPAAGARVGKEKENETTVMPAPARPVRGSAGGESAPGAGAWSGAASGGSAEGVVAAGGASEPGAAQVDVPGGAYVGQGEAHAGADAVELPGGTGAAVAPRPTGRRRGRPSPAEEQHEQAGPADTGARAGEDRTPPQGTGRRARRALAEPHGPGAESQPPAQGALPALGPGESGQVPDVDAADAGSTGGGRRARRLAAARARAEAAQTEQGPQHAPFALPPAPSEQAQPEAPASQGGASPSARTGDGPDPHVGESPAPSHAAPDPAAPALPAPDMPSEPGPFAPTGYPVSGEPSLAQQTESSPGLVPARPYAPDDAQSAPGAQSGQPAPAHGEPEVTGRQPHAPSAGEPAQNALSPGQQLPSGEQQFPAAPGSVPDAQQPLPGARSAAPDGPAPVAPESPGVRPAPGAVGGQSVPGASGVPEGQAPGAYASGAGPHSPVPGA